MNYGYGYNDIYSASNSLQGMAIWTIVALILSIIGGILVYFLFIKTNNKLSDNLKKLRDLLDFRIMLIEPILKIVYLIGTIFIILFSFNFITINFISFLLILIIGPVIIRIVYEAALILVMIWKNTKIISDNTKKDKDKDKEKTTKHSETKES